MKIYSKLYLFILFIFNAIVFGQQTPGTIQKQKIIINGGTFHIGNGQLIENGSLVFNNGKIESLQKNKIEAHSNALVINAEGKHIYPGIIAPNSNLGLLEISAVRATRDLNETGSFNPNVRSIIAYNTESKITETVRPNGVLLAQITPKGRNGFTGTSSIVHLDAWNWKNAILKLDDATHLYWPIYWYNSTHKNYAKNKVKYEKNIQQIKTHLIQAKNYTGKPLNLKLEALKKVFTEQKPLFIHANLAFDILRIIELKNSLDIQNIVLVGGAEAIQVADEIKNNNISVLASRVHQLPFYIDDDINYFYTLPIKLHQKGILVGLENEGDMPEHNTRNFPFYAGTLVGYGLNKETALQLITYNTAKILGIDAKYGSLEVGKSATLFISEGDALDIRTNHITHAFIDGRNISLNTFQKDLYEKFKTKLSEK